MSPVPAPVLLPSSRMVLHKILLLSQSYHNDATLRIRGTCFIGCANNSQILSSCIHSTCQLYLCISSCSHCVKGDGYAARMATTRPPRNRPNLPGQGKKQNQVNQFGLVALDFLFLVVAASSR